MDAANRTTRATSTAGSAKGSADYRPGYPADAVRWLVGTGKSTIVELGAGSGRLTAGLVALGHDVLASDPSTEKVATLVRAVPECRHVVARAEDIPLPSSSVDIVVASEAFHQFEQGRALPEIARVLRPGGVLALIWNQGDRLVPWVNKVCALMNLPAVDERSDPVDDSELFSTSDQAVFRHWQQFHRESLVCYVVSGAGAASMTSKEREELVADAGAIYDSYGRGPDGMLMPWKSCCYRARVTGLANFRRETADDDIDDGLLIDFT
ncbi:MAG: class I SAM-dependent methyltransferase [Nocardioidaceae bacterium]